ncbi:unnamed protein product [Cladocopium goreaui]|uniref:Uncharacterized protein n=1 Tax=Cladocopium goreaui TaxID=2562237 RepID=A0A9P1FPM3_9DINO|nr:unnamed protein product [Cladocopium goreaui]
MARRLSTPLVMLAAGLSLTAMQEGFIPEGRGPQGPKLSRRAMWLAPVLGKAAAAMAEEPISSDLVLVDATNLLLPSTETNLNRLLRKLQQETGLKLRLICPPRGIQDNRDEFEAWLKPFKKDLSVSLDTVVILAEERFMARAKQIPLQLMSIQAGSRLQERFQYRLTNGLLISIAERYGNSDSVAKTGPDLAIEQATRNVAAAMFALIDDPQVRYLRALPEDQVAKILQKHGL